ncbi:MAG: hypothetical protein IPK23_10035 [Rhizobiales bacterium]|nr:hypothetical protein [Hyphomicrobiales bacterium]
MKSLILGASFAVTLVFVQSAVVPVQAQSADEIKRICYNKHNLGKYGSTASEAQRKDYAAKFAACVRSKGKS